MHWGEMPHLTEAINGSEREQLMFPAKISTQWPQIIQPSQKCKNEICAKHGSNSPQEPKSFAMDPLLLHTVQLIQYSRKMHRLITAWQLQQHGDSKTGDTPIITPLSAAATMPELSGVTSRPSQAPFNYFTKDTDRCGSVDPGPEPMSIDAVTCRELLRRSVAALFSHIGYDNTTESLLELMVDVTHAYLTRFMEHLRAASDRQLQHGPGGFPDILEQVFHELGLGSVTSLHDFYQNRVICYHDNVLQNAQKLRAEYEALRSAAAISVDVKPETFTLIKIKDEPYSNDIQFPNLDESEDLDPDHLIQLEGLSNFEITVEQETVSGLTTEVDSRWNHGVKSETTESRAVAQLEKYAEPGSTPEAPPTTPAHSEASDTSQDPASMASSDIMSPPSLTKYTACSARKKKKRY